MACGCVDSSCSCVINGANGITVSGSGSAGNPFIIDGAGVTGPTFAAVNGGGLTITPGGTAGHTPTFTIDIDPASTAPVSVSGSGLRVDCCAPGAQPVDTVAADTLLVEGVHFTVLVDNTAMPIEIDLPLTPTHGTRFEIKDYGNSGAGNSSVNAITIDPNVGDTIEAVASYVMNTGDGEAVTIVYDSLISNWVIV